MMKKRSRRILRKNISPQIPACVLCASSQKALFRAHDRYHALPGEFRFVQCISCGLVSLNPQPSPRELARHYPENYYAYSFHAPSAQEVRRAIFFYKLYFSTEKPTFRTRLLQLFFLPMKHLLRGTSISPGAKILDVGCSNGTFLSKMKSAGMEPYGIEISKKGCTNARKLGIHVTQGVLERGMYPANHFDAVTLNHVFEHLRDPLETLRELKRIVKPTGKIIIAVPNANSLSRHLFGQYWAPWEVPRHLFIFSPSTMKRCAARAGLRAERTRFISFPYEFQVSIAYLLNAHKHRPIEESRFAMSKAAYYLLFPLIYLLDMLHIGGVIEVTLMKGKKSGDENNRSGKSQRN